MTVYFEPVHGPVCYQNGRGGRRINRVEIGLRVRVGEKEPMISIFILTNYSHSNCFQQEISDI